MTTFIDRNPQRSFQLGFQDETEDYFIPVDVAHALPIADTEHMRFMEGKSFETAIKATVNNGANYDVLIRIPSTLQYAHLFGYFYVTTSAPCDTFLFEGTSVSNNGTTFATFNKNRMSDTTALTLLSHTPTITNTGVQIEYDLLHGSKQDGGSFKNFLGHMILKGDTNYPTRLTNNSTGVATIAFSIHWYEIRT